jgi:ribonucleoside-diphosphate reductase alpha chain
MLGISGGIEPIFSYSFDRRTQSIHGEDVTYKVYPKIVEQYMWVNDIKEESKLPKFFTNAMLLDPKERIAMQAVWQKNIDASISSTINLPESTTVEQIMGIYIDAWKSGLKGITVYRDNCSRAGILTTKKEEPIKPVEQTIEEIKALRRGEWADLPEDIVYYKRKLYTGCGKLNVFIGYSEGDKRIHDLYAIRSGSGGCEKSVQTTIIAMAGMLRLGGNIFNIEKAFNGTGGCNSFLLKRAKGELLSKGSSCGTAVLYEIKAFLAERNADEVTMSATPTVKAVRKMAIMDKNITEIHKPIFTDEETKFIEKNGELNYIQNFNKCPLCNEKLSHTDGCISCPSCSYSKCT